jgi:vacuolar-type H+-ATPase catalytic subunit A/Vma1
MRDIRLHRVRERGKEMTEVLREFPELKDPRSGRPLKERTIHIANLQHAGRRP